MSVYSNRQICSCARCVHGNIFHITRVGYRGRPTTHGYTKCNIGLGSQFDYVHDYCKSFIERESDFMRICREKAI